MFYIYHTVYVSSIAKSLCLQATLFQKIHDFFYACPTYYLIENSLIGLVYI